MPQKLESPFLRRKPRVELVSLMDVMFLVLVFFVYSMLDMAVHRGVKVSLPSGAGAPEKGERIVITLKADDTLQLNGRDMPKDAIVADAAKLHSKNPDVPVLISGDAKASLGAGVELIAALKAAGVDKAAFQTSGESPERRK